MPPPVRQQVPATVTPQRPLPHADFVTALPLAISPKLLSLANPMSKSNLGRQHCRPLNTDTPKSLCHCFPIKMPVMQSQQRYLLDNFTCQRHPVKFRIGEIACRLVNGVDIAASALCKQTHATLGQMRLNEPHQSADIVGGDQIVDLNDCRMAREINPDDVAVFLSYHAAMAQATNLVKKCVDPLRCLFNFLQRC